MISVQNPRRVVPWYGYTDVQSNDLDEAMTQARCNWEVTKEPLECMGKTVARKVGLVRSDTKEVLSIVSPSYRVIQNNVAFDFLQDATDKLDLVKAGSVARGRKIFTVAKWGESWKVADDDIDLYLLFSNDHGGGALKVSITPIRVVCANTIRLGIKEALTSYSLGHWTNIETRLDHLRKVFISAKNYMNHFTEIGNRMVDSKIQSFESIRDMVLPKPEKDASERRNRQYLSRIEVLQACFEEKDLDPYKGTIWQAINGVSDFETHYLYKKMERTMELTLNNNLNLTKMVTDHFITQLNQAG